MHIIVGFVNKECERGGCLVFTGYSGTSWPAACTCSLDLHVYRVASEQDMSSS